jgi:hypothetical protein
VAIDHDKGFAITAERHAPHVLYLSGSLGANDTLELDVVGSEALARSTCGLVLDVGALASFDAAAVRSINRLGAAARIRRATVTVRTPETHLEAELTAAQFEPGVRTEVTHLTQHGNTPAAPEAPARPAPDQPALGTSRRTGRGFVESFGDGRECRVVGCTTRLSQYNSQDVCSLHDSSRSPRS